jgi:hypothetical protein
LDLYLATTTAEDPIGEQRNEGRWDGTYLFVDDDVLEEAGVKHPRWWGWSSVDKELYRGFRTQVGNQRRIKRRTGERIVVEEEEHRKCDARQRQQRSTKYLGALSAGVGPRS